MTARQQFESEKAFNAIYNVIEITKRQVKINTETKKRPSFNQAILSIKNLILADINADHEVVFEIIFAYMLHSALMPSNLMDAEVILELMDDATDNAVAKFLTTYSELYSPTTSPDEYEAFLEDEKQKVNASIGKN
jgi:hypothetical protein